MKPRSMYIPPNGFAGQGEQTQANQLVAAMIARPARKRRKAKRAKPRAAARAKPRKRKAKRPARLVKGSAAAKRYMASIRRKRRKR
jgi:hypothetical protein